MNKVLSITCIYTFLLCFSSWGQDKTFEFQGFSIGASLSGQEYFPRAMMPEIIHTGTE